MSKREPWKNNFILKKRESLHILVHDNICHPTASNEEKYNSAIALDYFNRNTLEHIYNEEQAKQLQHQIDAIQSAAEN